ncbi:MAG: hypothetical protein ACAI44_05270 [Candidatus Sericytochromatia bacterium]
MGNMTVGTTAPTYNPYASSPAPTGGTATPASTTPGSGFSTDFSSISSMVAHAGGGGFASYKLSGQMADSYKSMFGNGFKGFLGGMKDVAVTGFKGAGLSALVSAGVSAVANGVGAATGKVESSEAVSNVVKDTIGGALGGLTAVTAGGLGSLIFRGGGVMGTVISVGLGAVGGVLGGQVAKKLTENF